MPRPSAIVLANNLYRDNHAKTAHGLVRGPSRYPIVAVVDPSCPGEDAGALLDGTPRDIPVVASVEAALKLAEDPPTHCIIGVATAGGYLPDDLEASLMEAARAGLTLVNGLHQFLAENPELVRLTREHGGDIIDLRKPLAATEMEAWSGKLLEVPAPRLAVLGTDCALGKRTTAMLLRDALRAAGLKAEMIYTGQTGWLQGARYGFIFDATLNDFVCGELERACVRCWEEVEPDLMILEGQSALRHPYGPCGSELIVPTQAAGVILQHAPGRRYFVDMDELGLEIPPLEEEVELIRLLGSEVLALGLNDEGIDPASADEVAGQLEARLGIPAVYPLRDGVGRMAEVVRRRLAI